jgi:glycolate oxidase FAD binding subunit
MAFSGGGRVVKNAAGYDLCRLLCGSLGSLAVVTQVTLMVKPLPEASALVIAKIDDWAQAERLLADMVHTRVLPSAIELLAGAMWREEPLLGPPLDSGVARVVVGLEGAQAEVDWMVGQLHEQWQRLGVQPVGTHIGELGNLLWNRLGECSTAAPEMNGNRPWLVEAHLLPSAVVECVQQFLAVDPTCSIQAHAGSGVVRAVFPLSAERGTDILDSRIRPAVTAAAGSMVVRSRPAGTRLDRFAVWGSAKDTQRVMQTIKDQFDPHGILNPGRFIFNDR